MTLRGSGSLFTAPNRLAANDGTVPSGWQFSLSALGVRALMGLGALIGGIGAGRRRTP